MTTIKCIAEVRNVSSAKETNCLKVTLVTNEIRDEALAGKLALLKDSFVELEMKVVEQNDAF